VRFFFSGNEELAKHYAPIVTIISNNFAQLCKLRGLAQNASRFSLGEYGVEVSIQYFFGQVQAQIHAPLSVQEEVVVTETLRFKSAIWIRTFDEAVRFSYNGMFFSYSEYIEPVYEPAKLIITGVESHAPGNNAIVVAEEEYKGTIIFLNLTEPFGINSSFAKCSYIKNSMGYIARVEGYSIVTDGDFYGYKKSAFFCPDGANIKCISGGDVNFRDSITEFRDSVYIGEDFEVFAWGYGKFSWALGPDYQTVRSLFKSALSNARNVNTEEVAIWWFGTSGPVASTLRRVEFPSSFTTLYLSGNADTQITTFGPFDGVDLSGGDFADFGINVYVHALGSVDMTIKLIDTNGEIITHLIDTEILKNTSTSDWSTFWCDGANGKDGVLGVWVWFDGYVVPDRAKGSPRGYIQFYYDVDFFTPIIKTIAYSKDLGWKKCATIGDLGSTQLVSGQGFVMVVDLWWSTYSDFVLIQKVMYSFNTDDLILKKRELDAYGYGYFIYNDKITITPNRANGRSIIFLSEDAMYLSLYNFVDYQNGIYRIEGSSLNLIRAFEEEEIEPIFIDEKAGVLCTKKAILLDHGARVIQCNHCCGVFLDFTHYVDWLESGEFVINKIPDGDDQPVTVDILPAGMYNFYEFSEDASVCVISNYWSNPEDSQISAPAIVVDFSDPVYRFEPSDQVILQYMDPFIFSENNGAPVVGYPSVIPYGARYVSICECYPESGPQRKHYVYSGYKSSNDYNPRGSGFSNATAGVCPLQADSSISIASRFPTIVPQYSNATANRRDQRYDGKRLNRYIYHHTGKILRRVSEELEPINTELEISTTRRV